MGVGASFLEKEISSFEETWIAHMLGIHGSQCNYIEPMQKREVDLVQ